MASPPGSLWMISHQINAFKYRMKLTTLNFFSSSDCCCWKSTFFVSNNNNINSWMCPRLVGCAQKNTCIHSHNTHSWYDMMQCVSIIFFLFVFASLLCLRYSTGKLSDDDTHTQKRKLKKTLHKIWISFRDDEDSSRHNVRVYCVYDAIRALPSYLACTIYARVFEQYTMAQALVIRHSK